MTHPPGPRGHEPDPALSRRSFLKGAGGLAAGGALVAGKTVAAPAAPLAASTTPGRIAGATETTLRINGETRTLMVEPRTTLLSALRVHCEPPLTGTKEVCDRGACGACTVLLDDQPVYSCMQLALDCAGKEIRTIEGFGTPDNLSEVQQAFWEKDGLMCGFCTPGFVVSVTGCLERNPAATEADVRAACAGNLCRCGTYPFVFEAALEAGRRLVEGGR